jgi:hypothetical protein
MMTTAAKRAVDQNARRGVVRGVREAIIVCRFYLRGALIRNRKDTCSTSACIEDSCDNEPMLPMSGPPRQPSMAITGQCAHRVRSLWASQHQSRF